MEWGVAAVALKGESESGDRCVVQPFPGGILLAVIDGLGHGIEASSAAASAESVLRAQPQEPVISLVRRCHERLRSTRGVVMSVVSFDTSHGLMTWLGVGNVRGTLRRFMPSSFPSREELLLRAGVIGRQIPPLQAAVLTVSPGDTLFLASDGIKGEFAQERTPLEAPQILAEVILTKYAKTNDDAVVLVARVLGNRNERSGGKIEEQSASGAC
ncbi:MAG TPA: SpoIIE family protein phosphatase [Candidatus Acidoferrales bacterium]|nr:SpoIIE family protein phosphatase [Candidatus Acidoferrales bacterium]